MKDTSSPEHRAACEARFVLKKPLDERRAYLALVEKHRKVAGRLDLEEAMRTEWERRKNSTIKA